LFDCNCDLKLLQEALNKLSASAKKGTIFFQLDAVSRKIMQLPPITGSGEERNRMVNVIYVP